MSDISTMKQAQAAAFAAWQACPTSKKAEKARLQADLDAAAKAVAAAKRAILGQYSGPRLPEGATRLPEGASIRWLMVEVCEVES